MGVDEAEAHGSFEVFSWEELEVSPELRSRCCEALSSNSFTSLTLPPGMSDDIAELMRLSESFFSQPTEDRRSLGRLRLYKEKIVGYRELSGGASRFLEVHALNGGCGVMPRPQKPEGFAPVAKRVHAQMQATARSLVSWLSEYIGVPAAALLQSLDEADLSNLEPADCGSSVLRLCCYGCDDSGSCSPKRESASRTAKDNGHSAPAAEEKEEEEEKEEKEEKEGDKCAARATPAAMPTPTQTASATAADSAADQAPDEEPEKDQDDHDIFFAEHTDASFLTLAPVSSQPGLQIQDRTSKEWLHVEEGLVTEGRRHLMVFVGDFLEVLTKGRLVAAVHRVASQRVGKEVHHWQTLRAPTEELAGKRLSMPFLVRGQPSTRIDTASYLKAHPDAPLLPLEGISYSHLRQFLDLKGRQRFNGQLLLASSSAATDASASGEADAAANAGGREKESTEQEEGAAAAVAAWSAGCPATDGS